MPSICYEYWLESFKKSSYPMKIEKLDGLKMQPFPATSEAKIPPAGIANGKFHGLTTRQVPFSLILKEEFNSFFNFS